MNDPIFTAEIKGPLYEQKFTFLKDHVVCEWTMSPIHKGKRTCARNLLRGDIAEAEVCGHDIARNLKPAAMAGVIGLILLSGFENQIIKYLSVPFFLVSIFEVFIVLSKLRMEKWIYLLKNDGSYEISFCENYLKNMTNEEFRKRYSEYTSSNNQLQPSAKSAG